MPITSVHFKPIMQTLNSNILYHKVFGTLLKRLSFKNQKRWLDFNGGWERTIRRKNFGQYNIVKPGVVTEDEVPLNIRCPSYHESTVPDPPPLKPEIKDELQIMKMRESCSLARKILNQIEAYVKPGCTTDELNTRVLSLVVQHGAYPSPLRYRGFPKAVCTSVNNVACHGIPDDRCLVSGDIINVDITVFLDGYHGDCSTTYLVGEVDPEGRRLVEVTRECLDRAVSVCRPGERFSRIGDVVEEVADLGGFSVVPAFVGHGIGSYFHGPPDIYHCYNDYPGTMCPGMTFTIEPVLAQGSEDIVVLEDGWTAVTLDNGRAAQFEHTVLITPWGVDILTK